MLADVFSGLKDIYLMIEWPPTKSGPCASSLLVWNIWFVLTEPIWQKPHIASYWPHIGSRFSDNWKPFVVSTHNHFDQKPKPSSWPKIREMQRGRERARDSKRESQREPERARESQRESQNGTLDFLLVSCYCDQDMTISFALWEDRCCVTNLSLVTSFGP